MGQLLVATALAVFYSGLVATGWFVWRFFVKNAEVMGVEEPLKLRYDERGFWQGQDRRRG